jgi:citrate lyase beta subunit
LQAVGAKTGATAVATKVAAAGGYTLTPAAAAAGGGAAVIIGGAALAALLGYASVKTYKRLFGKWAKMCAGKKGAEKTACMKEARSKALQAQVADLQAALKVCADSKDPKKCSKGVAGKLGKLKAKLVKIK